MLVEEKISDERNTAALQFIVEFSKRLRISKRQK